MFVKKAISYLKNNKTKILYFVLAYFFIFITKTIYSLRHYNFGQDLARDLFLMDSAISNSKIFLYYGPKASVGNFYLFPAYYQISLFLSYLTNNHYLTMNFFVIFFESFSPILIYLILVKLNFKKDISIALSFLYLIFPLSMIFSSFAWNPNIIPFFSILVLYLSLIYFIDHRKKVLIFIPILLFLAVSFHLQAIILFPSFIFFSLYVFIKNRSDFKYLIGGIFISVFLFLPYVFGEYQNNFINTKSIFNYLMTEHSHYYQRVSKIDYLFNFFPSFFERVIFHQELKFNTIGRILFYFGMFFLLKEAFNKRGKYLFLTIHFFLVFLMLRVYKGDKIDYYMSILFVFPIFLLAFLHRYHRKLAILVMLLVALLSGSYYSSLKYNNELFNKIEMINYINEKTPTNNLRLLIHDDNDINTMLYLLNKKTDIKVNQNSLYVLEILPKKTSCASTFNRRQCLLYPGSAYSNLLMEKANGKRIETSYLENSNYCVNFWKLETNEHMIGYNLYNYDFDYGTDVLREELYEK